MPRLAESWEQTRATAPGASICARASSSPTARPSTPRTSSTSFERIMSDKNHLRIAPLLRRHEGEPDVVDDVTIDFKADPAQPILPLLMSTVTIVPSETPMDIRPRADRHRPLQVRQLDAGPAHRADGARRLLGREAGGDTATYLFRSDPAVRAAMVRPARRTSRRTISQQDATDAGDGLLVSRTPKRSICASTQHRAAQRHPRASGAEHGGRPRGLHRHDPCRQARCWPRRSCRRRRSAGTQTSSPSPTIPRRPRSCSRRPRRTASRSTPDHLIARGPANVPERHRDHGGDAGACSRTSASTSSCRCVEVAEMENYYSKPFEEGAARRCRGHA